MIVCKRIYDPLSSRDGHRVLVDRLWPRGVKREDAHIDEWLKDIAPSNELRRWFGSDAAKWPEFERRYRAELASPDLQAQIDHLRKIAKKGRLTLLFAKRDEERNNATALKEVLEEG
ncbi:MAG: DUF488 family protein [Hyphomicrobiaceae bacterium]|nr:DUF488 family protein [Hyphomicrobiaceae bacterium]